MGSDSLPFFMPKGKEIPVVHIRAAAVDGWGFANIIQIKIITTSGREIIMEYANVILGFVLWLEEIKDIDKADERADIACEIAIYEERKESGYYE